MTYLYFHKNSSQKYSRAPDKDRFWGQVSQKKKNHFSPKKTYGPQHIYFMKRKMKNYPLIHSYLKHWTTESKNSSSHDNHAYSYIFSFLLAIKFEAFPLAILLCPLSNVYKTSFRTFGSLFHIKLAGTWADENNAWRHLGAWLKRAVEEVAAPRNSIGQLILVCPILHNLKIEKKNKH